jgi:hypothetical protein
MNREIVWRVAKSPPQASVDEWTTRRMGLSKSWVTQIINGVSWFIMMFPVQVAFHDLSLSI